MKIYTKTGDEGKSSTFSGERRLKTDDVFEALGAIDELTSALGVASESCVNKGITDRIESIQCDLQDLASNVATPKSTATISKMKLTQFPETKVKALEDQIDDMTDKLPPLKNFILPSGGMPGAVLHLSRAICRRAERRVALLSQSDEVDWVALRYLNRLSDYLFTLARYSAMLDGVVEKIYRKPVE